MAFIALCQILNLNIKPKKIDVGIDVTRCKEATSKDYDENFGRENISRDTPLKSTCLKCEIPFRCIDKLLCLLAMCTIYFSDGTTAENEETHLFSFEACFAIQFSCVSCSLLKVERFFIINLRFFWGPPSTTNADDGIY